MMIVKDFAMCACQAEEITVAIGGNEYNLISENTGEVDNLMLEIFGDYVVEDFKANQPDKYCVWVMERPIKIGEL